MSDSYYSRDVQVGDVIEGTEYWHIVNSYSSRAPTDIELLHNPTPVHSSPFVGKRYVVIHTEFTGGTGYESNGHYVIIQELDKDFKYNPNGRSYSFFQTGNFRALVRECKVLGKMTRKVTYE